MIDTLSLLALKVAPNVFDLSSGLAHVSMRDQVVRARLLVRDLVASGEPCRKLLVVGAGIAGISVATAGAAAGVEVLVVDTNTMPMALQEKVTSRYVGPFMYEWPFEVFADQSYPPSDPRLWPTPDVDTPTWMSTAPLPANVLGNEVRNWLHARLASGWGSKPSPRLLMRTAPASVKAFVLAFRTAPGTTAAVFQGQLWPRPMRRTVTFAPDFVVLAAGLGQEEVVLPGGLAGVPFWSNDTLKAPTVTSQTTGIFGSGDGALQDVLRALTIHDHPLQLVDQIQASPAAALLASAIGSLGALEQEYRLQSAWTVAKDKSHLIDKKCQMIARKLANKPSMRAEVANALRIGTGEVRLYMRDHHFSKAYLLNRFAVHLIEQAQIAHRSGFAGRMKLDVRRGVDVTNSFSSGVHRSVTYTQGGSTTTDQLDSITVRFGIVGGTVPGQQLVGLTKPRRNQRTLLAQVPMPLLC